MRRDGNTYILDNMRDDFPDLVTLISQVIHDPIRIDGRLCYEMRHSSLTLMDPLDALPLGVNLKELSTAFAALQALQLVSSTPAPSLSMRINADPVGEWRPSASVRRVRDALENCAALLRSDPETRLAVAHINLPIDIEYGSRALTLQFLGRDGVLDLIVNFRSVDVVHELSYDFFQYGQLLTSMAQLVNVGLGVVHFHIASMVFRATDLRVLDVMQRTDERTRPTDLPTGLAGWIEKDWNDVAERAKFVLDVAAGKIVDGVNPNSFLLSERWFLEQLRPYWVPEGT